MRSTLLAAMAALTAVSLVPKLATADPTQLGPNASSQEFVHALAPKAGTPVLKFRGLRVLNSSPAGEAVRKAAPSVAVDIRFALNSAALSNEAIATINQIAKAMKSDQLAKYHFMLEGHTDTTGTRAYNIALSQRRAEAVRDYLVDTDHIAADRLGARGVGPDDLVDPANPTSGVNRRVEILNLGE